MRSNCILYAMKGKPLAKAVITYSAYWNASRTTHDGSLYATTRK